MPGITNGAELVKRLKATGTGEAKLAAARRVLADVSEQRGRVATAAEVIAGLAEAGAGEGTLDKARQLAETGEYKGPAAAPDLAIEDRLLAAPPADDDRPADGRRPAGPARR